MATADCALCSAPDPHSWTMCSVVYLCLNADASGWMVSGTSAVFNEFELGQYRFDVDKDGYICDAQRLGKRPRAKLFVLDGDGAAINRQALEPAILLDIHRARHPAILAFFRDLASPIYSPTIAQLVAYGRQYGVVFAANLSGSQTAENTLVSEILSERAMRKWVMLYLAVQTTRHSDFTVGVTDEELDRELEKWKKEEPYARSARDEMAQTMQLVMKIKKRRARNKSSSMYCVKMYHEININR